MFRRIIDPDSVSGISPVWLKMSISFIIVGGIFIIIPSEIAAILQIPLALSRRSLTGFEAYEWAFLTISVKIIGWIFISFGFSFLVNLYFPEPITSPKAPTVLLRCDECGYILNYINSDTCPECGLAFDSVSVVPPRIHVAPWFRVVPVVCFGLYRIHEILVNQTVFYMTVKFSVIRQTQGYGVLVITCLVFGTIFGLQAMRLDYGWRRWIAGAFGVGDLISLIGFFLFK
jgi:hypothetical protein